MHAEDENRQPSLQLADPLEDVEAAAIGQGEIENHDVPRVRLHERGRLAAGPDLLDDGGGVGVDENVADAAPDDRMIVDEHDPEVLRPGHHDRGSGVSGRLRKTTVPW